MRDATCITPCARCIERTLRCTDSTLPRPPAGYETKGGDWIWICEGLVIVLLTETCHRTAVSERRQEKQRVVMSTQTGGARDPCVSEGILVWTAASRSSSTPKREEGDQVCEHQLQLRGSGAVCTLSGCCDLHVLVFQ